jgi:hypothetical protein
MFFEVSKNQTPPIQKLNLFLLYEMRSDGYGERHNQKLKLLYLAKILMEETERSMEFPWLLSLRVWQRGTSPPTVKRFIPTWRNCAHSG